MTICQKLEMILTKDEMMKTIFWYCVDMLNAVSSWLGGAIGFLVMKNNPDNHLSNFGQGAVYFGWLGTLVGVIAITGDRFMVWGDVEKMGPALAVSMLTILYGYSIKLVTIALAKD